MNENLKLALEKLEQNPELKEEVMKNPPKTVEDILAIAARLGVTLTADDLKLDSKELSLDDADQFAGGRTKEQMLKECAGGRVYIFCILGFGGAYWMPDSRS